MDATKFSEKVKHRRAELRYTQEELGESMGAAQSMVNRWEHGHMPQAAHLLSLARALKVSVDYLLDDAVPPGGDVPPGLDPIERMILARADALGPEQALHLLYLASTVPDLAARLKKWGAWTDREAVLGAPPRTRGPRDKINDNHNR